MDTVVRSNRNIVYNCHYHVVFCPKYRRKVLTSGIDDRLKVLLRENVEKWGQELVECEVMPDHVHLLVGCDPQFGIHRLVKFVKGATAHQLRQEYPILKHKLPSLWTNSYYVGTTGGVTLETVKKYVESQKGK
jgi:putative transposase